MNRVLNMAGIAIGLVAVVIQLVTGLDSLMANYGLSRAGAVVAFFSYFTILTNLLAVAVHAAALGYAPRFFARERVRGTTVVAIVVVAIVYHVLLRSLWNPQGVQLVTDVMLHYIAPALMLIWWLGWGRTGRLSPRDVPLLLIYPLLYLAYVMARAPIAGVVPYPFLDYWQHGWPAVLQSIGGILVLFVATAVAAIAADRFLPRPGAAA